MSEALEVITPQQQQSDWLAVSKVRERVNAIQNLLENVMKKDVHYGVIPGTKKPSLWKPGSEQILSMFQMEVDPIVEDLSTPDEARFRVLCRLTRGGKFLGAGIGEASSNEQKYKWRSTVSKAEWEWYQKHAPERTRIKFTYKGEIEQVRTEIADVSNTILKMAKKRAQVDATLTVTGCSDIFDQDIEDLPPEMLDGLNQDAPTQAPIKPTAKKVPPQQPAPAPATPLPTQVTQGEAIISEGQRKRLFAIQGSVGMSDSVLKKWLEERGIKSRSLIPVSLYEQVIDYIDSDYQFHQRAEQEEPF